MRLSLPELVIILVVLLLIFGAGRLPDLGAALGKSIRGFRKRLAGSQGSQVGRRRRGPTKAEGE